MSDLDGRIDKRAKDLEVNVQAILTGIILAALAAVFWQLLALKGEVAGGLARLDERLAGFQRSVEQLFDAVERRLDAVEKRLPPP